jgi:hypothetical protein
MAGGGRRARGEESPRASPGFRRAGDRPTKAKSPDITALGLKDWSETDVEDALSTGFTPSGDVLGGPMAAVVRSLSQVPGPDLAAIAHYLKTYRAGVTR